MKRNKIIIAAVVIISALVIGLTAHYRLNNNNSSVNNQLDPSVAASVISNEVSGTVSDSASTEASSLTIVPEGVYTNGSESMVFTGNTVDISGMVFNYTLNNGYITLDTENLYFSDEFIAVYKEENGEDADIDTQLEKTRESASDIILQYSESFDWVTYEEYIFKRTEDYATGPSGTYASEDDSNITITFDNGTATYVNGDITETHPYVLYLDGEDLIVTFYSMNLYSTDLYNNYCENNYFYYSDETTIDLGFGTFTKAE